MTLNDLTMTLRDRIHAIVDNPFPFPELDDRERKALALAASGKPVSQIAGATRKPPRTAYRILESGLAKLTAHYHGQITRTDLPGLMLDQILAELEKDDEP